MYLDAYVRCMAVMPMFPLGHPLLPGSLLPLHVFEERYRQMIRDVLAKDDDPPRFGVVMIERGTEVGGGDLRSMVGTIARIDEIDVSPDGRYGLVAVGTTRFRVTAWLPDDPYPLAEVEPWDDAPSAAGAPDVAERHRRVQEINALASSLGDAVPDDDQIADDPWLGCFHLAALAPLGASDRQRVLAAPSLIERLEALDEALDDAMAVLRFRRT